MLPDRVSNPGPLTYESGALPIALRGPAMVGRSVNKKNEIRAYIQARSKLGCSLKQLMSEFCSLPMSVMKLGSIILSLSERVAIRSLKRDKFAPRQAISFIKRVDLF